MSSEGSDIDVVNVDDSGIAPIIPDVESIAIYHDYNHDILKSFVSARTDGLRLKRKGDYHISSDDSSISETEVTHHSEPPGKINSSNQPKPAKPQTFSSIPGKQIQQPLFMANLNDVEAHNDIFVINSNHIGEYALPIDGVNELLLSHRTCIDIPDSSEDDEAEEEQPSGAPKTTRVATSSSDSDDNGVATVKSSVAELRDMAKLDIKDRKFRENFPEVEIIDLQLSDIETVCPLGSIFHIVDDFVVIKNCASGKILDLDSMVFDKDKKCIGYIFEVLGPVTEPYYTVRFNKNSDIKLLGLEVGQELFYSDNERYTRFLLLELLQEFEKKRRSKVQDSTLWSSDDSDSGGENTVRQDKPTKMPVRQHPPKVFTRSTNNYTINYQSQVPSSQRAFNRGVGSNMDNGGSPYDDILRNYKPQRVNNSNSAGFKDFVLNSFLD